MSVMAILGLGPDPLIAGFLVAAVFLAGALRGYSGFGFALAAVPLLTTCWPPVLAIPVVLILEMVLTVAFLPGLWVSIDRRSVALLVVGAAIATPIGQWVLSHLNPGILRIAVGFLLLMFVAILWTPSRRARGPLRAGHSPVLALGAGAASGLLNGGTAMSGPPIILYYLGREATAEISRASMMAYFLLSAAVAIAIGGVTRVYAANFGLYALKLAPFALAGSFVGGRCFAAFPAAAYRHAALVVLALLGLYTLASESLGFLGTMGT
jgi:uncharacterized membrane protein YfcA